MHEQRLVELLANAVVCFERSSNPFSNNELLRLNVTADECIDLSVEIADILQNELYLMIGSKYAEGILEKVREMKQK
mgnify:CR=1 FL=1